MDAQRDSFMKSALGTLGEGVVPTAEQKERIFESVLTEARDHPLRYRIREFITICPWRFAFGAAAVQARPAYC